MKDFKVGDEVFGFTLFGGYSTHVCCEDKYVNDNDTSSNGISYRDWATGQLPRVLLGLGDVLGALTRQADAADAYSRAIPFREAALEGLEKEKDLNVEHLKKRRQLVEANVLVAEAILACPENEDVVTSETKDLLVKASERVDYARGYYDKARDDLQDTGKYVMPFSCRVYSP